MPMSQAPRIYVRGSYIDIHDNQNVYLSVDKDGEVTTHIDKGRQPEPAVADTTGELPNPLCTPQAEALHAKLCDAGILDAHWQPVGLSFTEKGTLVDYIGEKLGIRGKWKLFGSLWHTESETLRTSKTRGLDQDKTWAFRTRLEAL